jgi:serine/threonine protein kinase
MQGTSIAFVNFQGALRIPTSSDGEALLIEPQPLPTGMSNTRCVAAELLKEEAFDGYAVDLWSTGVMLFLLLLGTDALFEAPIPEDKKFKEICIHGNLKGALGKWDENAVTVSDEALDLLQCMLRADPRDRLSLMDVQAHAWVTHTDTAPPARLSRTESIQSLGAF